MIDERQGQQPDSVASNLVSALEREAQLVDHGALTIDAQAGLAKLARHQLADPHHYVLRLAEAGVRLGATELWFWTTPSSLIAHFVRTPEPVTLSASVLDGLLTVLFATEGKLEQRAALVQLAVAANTASRLAPEQLWIESVEADGRGHRLRLESEPMLEAIADAQPGLWFRLRSRPSSMLARLRERPERRVLLERASWSGIPIHVDNHRLGYGFQFASGTPIRSASGQTIGFAGVAALAVPELVLCAAGLEVERLQLELGRAPPGFFAVFEADLDRDASFAQFIRGPVFDQLIERVLATDLVPLEERMLARRRRKEPRKFLHVSILATILGLPLGSWAAIANLEGLAILLMMMMIAGPFGIYISRRLEDGRAEIVGPRPRKIARAKRRQPALVAATSTRPALPESSADS